MILKYIARALSFCLIANSPQVISAPINLVDYFSLSGTEIIDFESVPTPGGSTNFDSILDLTGASFAEHFVGQTLSFSGASDVLGGSPTASLTLQIGATGENVLVAEAGPNKGIAGLGVGSLNGEGALAILFDTDQMKFGIVALGGDSGTATFDFWARDGSLIHSISPTGLSAINYFGFSRESGEQDIAGVSIWNTDPGGIGYDDIVFRATTVPLPGSLLLLITGLLGLISFSSKKNNL